ncbi:MAG: DUF3011 domain-containing protein, partial [Gammaproteobacteria bacterium]
RRPIRLGFALGLVASAFGLVTATQSASADDYSAGKSVSCSSDDGHRRECAADLRGYMVRDVDQSSRTKCVVGRNWGYDERGVWVDDGCRATFKFDKGRGRDEDRARIYSRNYGDHRPDAAQELRVKCESRDGHRSNCDADLRGYRLVDVREESRADCDVGRNFGYDSRGVWADGGCRGEFIFSRTGGGDRGDRYSDRRDHDDDSDRR